MKTVGVFCFGDEPSEGPSGDPEELLSSEGSEDVETSPPCGASQWWSRRFLRSNCTSIDNFLGFLVEALVAHGITTMIPKPTQQPAISSLSEGKSWSYVA